MNIPSVNAEQKNLAAAEAFEGRPKAQGTGAGQKPEVAQEDDDRVTLNIGRRIGGNIGELGGMLLKDSGAAMRAIRPLDPARIASLLED